MRFRNGEHITPEDYRTDPVARLLGDIVMKAGGLEPINVRSMRRVGVDKWRCVLVRRNLITGRPLWGPRGIATRTVLVVVPEASS